MRSPKNLLVTCRVIDIFHYNQSMFVPGQDAAVNKNVSEKRSDAERKGLSQLRNGLSCSQEGALGYALRAGSAQATGEPDTRWVLGALRAAHIYCCEFR